MDEIEYCQICKASLTTRKRKASSKKCESCINGGRINQILSPDNLKTSFSKRWVAELLFNYNQYLCDVGITSEVRLRHLQKAKKIFMIADTDLIKVNDICEEWLDNVIATSTSLGKVKNSLMAYLDKKGILKIGSNDSAYLKKIENLIDQVPIGFKRLLEIYYKDRMETRKRQISNQARKPLSLRTILTDIEMFVRFTRWIGANYPNTNSWDLVEENQYNEFLLSLTPKHREIVRKDLHALLRFAKRKKVIFHIPLADSPSRELPSSTEPLDYEQQRKVAKLIQSNIYENPLGSLLSSLCLYQGLSSFQIRNIKLKDIDVDNKKIHIVDREPIFLCKEELIALKEYTYQRSLIKNSANKDYLIIPRSSSVIYSNKPADKMMICEVVKSLTGYTPTVLRITCFSVFSERYGPQILVEAFGLSMTQASRYGKLEEYLLEQEIKTQKV